MREINAQKELVDITFKVKKTPKNPKGLKVYKELVFHRFFEVLSNAFPIFYSIIDEKRFEKIVYEFMKTGAKTPVMWKLPNEFRIFVKNNKICRDIIYVDKLLWFEWIEVELIMQDYKPQKKVKFSWAKEYKLNASVVLKKLNYKIFEKGSYEQKGEYYLCAYYGFENFEVYFREISLPLYLFLKELNKNGLKRATKLVAKLSDQKQKEVKLFFKETLKELSSLQILKGI